MFDLKAFEQPQPQFGIHPFWFWNGEMDDGEIISQIRSMAEQGIGGFFICPRQGMKIPYLSEVWFRKVKLSIETAGELGLEVWLYDEYPYPSGIAGGEVVLTHPEAKHYTLAHVTEKVQDGKTSDMELPWARILYARAVPLDAETGERCWDQSIDVSESIGNFQSEPVFQKTGLTAYNQKRFFTYRTVKKLHWTPPRGEWELHFFLEAEVNDFKYYGTFVDPCHAEAIKTFIEMTHERYAKAIGEYFGKTVKGMFTDETGLLGKLPWSPRLPKFFESTFGYDLKSCLPALLFNIGEETAKIRYHYFQAIHLLIRQTYHKQIHDWCEKYQLQYVAEVPSVRMTTQLYSHVPGGDSAHDKLGRTLDWIMNRYFLSYRSNPKSVSALSHQLGRERALIECFHSVGWSMTLQDAKWMIDRMAAMGINFFNFHAFFYTVDGLTKHDAPPSQFLQNPYWRHFRHLSDYVKRISYVTSQGTPERLIAVLDPTTTIWSFMGNPFHRFGYCGSDEQEKRKLEKIKHDWLRICKEIVFAGKDYDPLDAELLAEAEVADGVIRIGNAAYSVLILPPMTSLEQGARRQIKKFLDQGGTVIACGLLPYERIDTEEYAGGELFSVFGVEESSLASYWNEEVTVPAKPWRKGERNAYFLPMGAEALDLLLSILDRHAPDEVKFEVPDGSKSFIVHRRRLSEDSSLIFIANQEGGEHEGLLSCDTAEDGVRIVRLNLESGLAEPVTLMRDGAVWRVPVHFAPYASHAFIIERVNGGHEFVANSVSAEPYEWELAADGRWEMEMLGENAVRIDSFELEMDLREGQPEEAMQVQVKPFIDQAEEIADEHLLLPLRFQQIFGTPKKKEVKYPIRCRYTKRFHVEYLPEACLLLKDSGAISGDYVIRLNGNKIVEEDFNWRFIYDNSNQVTDVALMLKAGENTLSIEVTIANDWDGVVDALYLIGDFGVRTTAGKNDGPAIVPVPREGLLQNGPYEGLPYYAGTIAFRRNITLSDIPDTDTFRLVFRDWDANFHDCAEVLVNGHSLGVRPWTPYVWEGRTDLLTKGANRIEVRVTNTLIGLLEGKWFDYEAHVLKDI
ncbi:glycosyl hydrolase [Paenibacillus alkalitolerans]|uniref:glycosyl hydrolase n=1 Tax=Paenibacillus alkalitolerans TaxID=2799335 RepID=UPI0018F60627|nr:glycosyl hydrolase [Paenibacillus alkalitolerans]